ncbi:MAG TPA: methyltransferase [Gammaproteobacteria bacterium]|nr:methyltransferase [Gammaproteobacteria bacterium]
MASFSKHRAAVRFVSLAMRFAAWLQALPNRMTPPPFRLLQIGSAFWQSRALYVAARLDVATRLGDKTCSATEIARLVGADSDALQRLLRMLASMGVFEQAGDTFRNNGVSDWMREDRPNNMRAMILMHNSPEMSRPWYEQLEQGVRKGEVPFALTHGEEMYRYMDNHPDFDAEFARAMESVDALTGEAFATDVDWGRFERLIDVGGSKGFKALAILKHYPKLRALVFDRPNVIEDAHAYWREHDPGIARERIRFEAGDMFESVPAAEGPNEAYLLAGVLHGLSDEECAAVLKNVARAGAAAGAYVAIMEIVVPSDRPDYLSASFDMQMFMGTRGRERSLAQWSDLLRHSGLTLVEEVSTRSMVKVLVARPASD